ncbi:YkvA family protein [Flindersiella endophytica]
MSWGLLLDIGIGVAVALLAAWVLMVIALAVARPKGGLLKEAMRILPDLLRLLRRLAGDRTLPRGVRVRLGLLLAYLAIPFDLIPDFIPVLGYADDAIIVTVVLRSVVRHAGLQAVEQHWPGTPDGFAALCRLTGIRAATNRPEVDESPTPEPGPGGPASG